MIMRTYNWYYAIIFHSFSRTYWKASSLSPPQSGDKETCFGWFSVLLFHSVFRKSLQLVTPLIRMSKVCRLIRWRCKRKVIIIQTCMMKKKPSLLVILDEVSSFLKHAPWKHMESSGTLSGPVVLTVKSKYKMNGRLVFSNKCKIYIFRKKYAYKELGIKRWIKEFK